MAGPTLETLPRELLEHIAKELPRMSLERFTRVSQDIRKKVKGQLFNTLYLPSVHPDSLIECFNRCTSDTFSAVTSLKITLDSLPEIKAGEGVLLLSNWLRHILSRLPACKRVELRLGIENQQELELVNNTPALPVFAKTFAEEFSHVPAVRISVGPSAHRDSAAVSCRLATLLAYLHNVDSVLELPSLDLALNCLDCGPVFAGEIDSTLRLDPRYTSITLGLPEIPRTLHALAPFLAELRLVSCRLLEGQHSEVALVSSIRSAIPVLRELVVDEFYLNDRSELDLTGCTALEKLSLLTPPDDTRGSDEDVARLANLLGNFSFPHLREFSFAVPAESLPLLEGFHAFLARSQQLRAVRLVTLWNLRDPSLPSALAIIDRIRSMLSGRQTHFALEVEVTASPLEWEDQQEERLDMGILAQALRRLASIITALTLVLSGDCTSADDPFVEVLHLPVLQVLTIDVSVAGFLNMNVFLSILDAIIAPSLATMDVHHTLSWHIGLTLGTITRLMRRLPQLTHIKGRLLSPLRITREDKEIARAFRSERKRLDVACSMSYTAGGEVESHRL